MKRLYFLMLRYLFSLFFIYIKNIRKIILYLYCSYCIFLYKKMVLNNNNITISVI